MEVSTYIGYFMLDTENMYYSQCEQDKHEALNGFFSSVV
jgi:hypothetical protein